MNAIEKVKDIGNDVRVKVKTVIKKAGIDQWGIGEWGSVASIMGVGLWVYDQTRKKKKS